MLKNKLNNKRGPWKREGTSKTGLTFRYSFSKNAKSKDGTKLTRKDRTRDSFVFANDVQGWLGPKHRRFCQDNNFVIPKITSFDEIADRFPSIERQLKENESGSSTVS